MNVDTGNAAHAISDSEVLRVFQLNQALTERGGLTLGVLADLGLATVAGNLSTPRGTWSCPWCWMDYERPGYRTLDAELSRPAVRARLE